MRKINKILKEHWNTNTPVKISNSAINTYFDNGILTTTLTLFNNVIARKTYTTSTTPNKTEFTLAGWDTLTTRSRLKEVLGLSLFKHNSQLLFSHKDNVFKIESNQWYTL